MAWASCTSLNRASASERAEVSRPSRALEGCQGPGKVCGFCVPSAKRPAFLQWIDCVGFGNRRKSLERLRVGPLLTRDFLTQRPKNQLLPLKRSLSWLCCPPTAWAFGKCCLDVTLLCLTAATLVLISGACTCCWSSMAAKQLLYGPHPGVRRPSARKVKAAWQAEMLNEPGNTNPKLWTTQNHYTGLPFSLK